MHLDMHKYHPNFKRVIQIHNRLTHKQSLLMKNLKLNLLEKKEMGEVRGGAMGEPPMIHACTCMCGPDDKVDERNDVYKFRNPGINIEISITGDKVCSF